MTSHLRRHAVLLSLLLMLPAVAAALLTAPSTVYVYDGAGNMVRSVDTSADPSVCSATNGTCQGGTTCCGGACTDTRVDDFNCGQCGRFCGLMKACTGGQCVSTCQGSGNCIPLCTGCLCNGVCTYTCPCPGEI